MKYYSEVLKKAFDSEKDCLIAEKQYAMEQEKAQKALEKRSAERKVAAEKVEVAHKAAVDANKAYREALNEFCSTYGAYHSTLSVNDVDDIFNWFFHF